MKQLLCLILAGLTICQPPPAEAFQPNDLWLELSSVTQADDLTVAQLRVHGLVPGAVYTPCVRCTLTDPALPLHELDFIAAAGTQDIAVSWPGTPDRLFYSIYGKRKLMQPLTENLFCLTLGASLAFLLWRSLRG